MLQKKNLFSTGRTFHVEDECCLTGMQESVRDNDIYGKSTRKKQENESAIK